MAEDVRRMADLLKSGATMLSDTCPVCSSPLFRIKGEVFCAKCNKPVVYEKATATGPSPTVSASHLLDSLEQTIMTKLNEANEALKSEKEPQRLTVYSNLVFGWLSTLEKLRSVKESLR
jgi:UPF0148 protein